MHILKLESLLYSYMFTIAAIVLMFMMIDMDVVDDDGKTAVLNQQSH